MLIRLIEFKVTEGEILKMCVYFFNDSFTHKGVSYQLDGNLSKFLDNKINDLFLDKDKLYLKETIKNLDLSYKTEKKFNVIENLYKEDHSKKISDLERLKDKTNKNYLEEPNLYKDFYDNEYLPDKTELERKYENRMNNLNKQKEKEMNDNIKLFKNPSILNKTLNKVTKKNSYPKFKK